MGRIDNCQIGTFLAYVNTNRDRVLIDRELYIPEGSWFGDPDRCAEAAIPADLTFKTRPKQVSMACDVGKLSVCGASFSALRERRRYCVGHGDSTGWISDTVEDDRACRGLGWQLVGVWMTHYAVDASRNALVVVWDTGDGELASTVADFPESDGNSTGACLRLAASLTFLSGVVWRCYTHPVSAAGSVEPNSEGWRRELNRGRFR